jgi:methylase of polypeptide subunit release factors
VGQLWFEINENFGKEVVSLLTENNFHNPKLHHDINGKQRFVSAGL